MFQSLEDAFARTTFTAHKKTLPKQRFVFSRREKVSVERLNQGFLTTKNA
ncbi:hypothetical protein KUF54_08060 [Comamonas sp. Y33R10-2]|nr:hypothetical protein [Comamonas sp. Y33R10-2]QXZ11122.1 hypothetical protein KUF54_08060 [Comamonas sp. Y33R10-2]